MPSALIVYGSRHGATRGIAERIGEVLRADGLEADVVAADGAPDLPTAMTANGDGDRSAAMTANGASDLPTAMTANGDGDRSAVGAVVVGSGVYMGSWLKEPLEFLRRNQAVLAAMPVWLFSSGPLKGSSTSKDADDPLESALGPTDGPGSGGRKKLAEVSTGIQPRDHRVFFGAFNPDDPPRALSERLVRMMPASRGLLPPGDFRDWDAIEAWAHEIASALATPPVRA
jgi:menaquinone-dependent protoporphyrinogen oxidase